MMSVSKLLATSVSSSGSCKAMYKTNYIMILVLYDVPFSSYFWVNVVTHSIKSTDFLD